MYSILVVDDDLDVIDVLSRYFIQAGFDVHAAHNAGDAMHIIENYSIECIVLDIQMPGTDGLELCTSIRQKMDVPIIFLTNYSDEEMRISGFLSGGSDYVTKPFSLRELELRIYARIKQSGKFKPLSDVLRFGDLVLNTASHMAYYDDNLLDLTSIEFDILIFLASHPNAVFHYSQIYTEVWQQPSIDDAHTLHVHVARLRKKLNALSPDHMYIETVKSKGYRFCP